MGTLLRASYNKMGFLLQYREPNVAEILYYESGNHWSCTLFVYELERMPFGWKFISMLSNRGSNSSKPYSLGYFITSLLLFQIF